MWKEHSRVGLENPPKVQVEPITKIIYNQQDFKQGLFTEEKLNVVLIKIKDRKAGGLDEIPAEVWKTKQFDDIPLTYCYTVFKQNIIDGEKTSSSIFPRKVTSV